MPSKRRAKRTLYDLQRSAANGGLSSEEMQLAFRRARHMRSLAYRDVFSKLLGERRKSDSCKSVGASFTVRARGA